MKQAGTCIVLKDTYGEKMIKSSEFDMNNTDPEIGKHINTDPEKAKHVEICLMFIVYVYCL